jgi:hypothetical protein
MLVGLWVIGWVSASGRSGKACSRVRAPPGRFALTRILPVYTTAFAYAVSPRRGGRVAEGGGLLNRYRGLNPYRGFESPSLRHSYLSARRDIRPSACPAQTPRASKLLTLCRSSPLAPAQNPRQPARGNSRPLWSAVSICPGSSRARKAMPCVRRAMSPMRVSPSRCRPASRRRGRGSATSRRSACLWRVDLGSFRLVGAAD